MKKHHHARRPHNVSSERQRTSPSSSWLIVLLFGAVVLGYMYWESMQPANFADENNDNEIPRDQYDNIYKPSEGSPYISILSPKSGDVIKSSTVGIRVNVTNFYLADISNRPNVENQGHLLYTLDGKEQRGIYKVTSFANVAKGDHTLTVELQDNDKTNLNSRVFATVSFKTE